MLLRPLTVVASLALVVGGAATACSAINSPDDPIPPNEGGTGGSGGSGGGQPGGSGGSGGDPCPNGEVLCADSCIDPLTDDEFCGASGDCTGDNAGVACPSHAPCADGECGHPFPPSLFPIGVPGTTGGYSDLVLDPDGNLLVPTQDSRTIIRVDRTDGSTDAFALGIGTSGIIVAVAYDTVRDQIYTGGTSSTNEGPIYVVDPDDGSSQDLTTLTNRVTSLSVAPAGFGAYGGHLIASTSVGEIIAIDPDDPTTPTTITTMTAWVGDTAFTSDATLYVAGDPPVDVSTVAADGTDTQFATGFSSADGLVIDEVGSRMFVADSGADKLYSVAMAGGTLTDLGDYDFDNGFFASGLAYDGVYTVIMATGEAGGLTLQAHSLQ